MQIFHAGGFYPRLPKALNLGESRHVMMLTYTSEEVEGEPFQSSVGADDRFSALEAAVLRKADRGLGVDEVINSR
jgi:hypothetical protein